MEKILKFWAIIVLVALLHTASKAQDYHLSQYDMSPMFLNPALTGLYGGERGKPGELRMMANYRSQWQRLESKPYSTAAIAFDKPIKRFGVGAYIMDNLAGRSNYNTFNFIVGGSYEITAPESKDHFLTTGLQIGLINRKFGMDELLFESQYTSSQGLDGTLDNGENFQKFSILRFDSNIGFYYKYKNPLSDYNPFLGLSVYHLNKPDQAVAGTESRMPMRFNIHVGSDIYVDENVNIKPMILYMYQGKAQELNLGAMIFYHMKETQYDIVGGVSYRWKDAVVINAGLKQGQSTFRMSYDIVTSGLKTFNGKRGAIELGVVYSGLSKKRVVYNTI